MFACPSSQSVCSVACVCGGVVFCVCVCVLHPSRLSEILQAEEPDTHEPRRQESVLGRVRRLLSVQEPPDLSNPRPTFKRHSSDIPSFFPFVPDHRVYPGGPDDTPMPPKPPHPGHPHTHLLGPHPLDTLATLQEVNSTPSSPDTDFRSPTFTDVPEVVISAPSLSDNYSKSSTATVSPTEAAPKTNTRSSNEAPPASPVQALKPEAQVEGDPREETPRAPDTPVCYTPTRVGPRKFRWSTPADRMKKRQLSFQLSRQGSRSSLHSLPSPRILGRRRGQHASAPSPLESPQQEENPVVPGTDIVESQGTDKEQGDKC